MRRRIGWVAASVVLGLVGCSSGDDGGDATSPAAATTNPQSETTSPPVSLVVPSTTDRGVIGPPSVDELDTPSAPVVCMLLSTDEVGSALGLEVAGSEEGGTIDDETPCQYLDSAGEPVLRLKLTGPTHEPPPAELLAAAMTEGEPLDGIGDGAVQTQEGVHVLFVDQLVSVLPLDAAGAADPVALVDLATLAVSRL